MPQASIGFIGAGNMASSLIGGLIKQGLTKGEYLACDPTQGQLDKLSSGLGNPENLTTSVSNEAISDSDVVVLAVKPQVMHNVAKELRTHLKPDVLVISIAAGISVETLQTWLGDVAVVRCMPNTPALIQQGASGLFASQQVSGNQKAIAEQILSAVGVAYWVDSEHLIDVVTALSGSGPAYFFLFMELMAANGEKMGLPADVSQALAIQTCVGSGLLASGSEVDLETLRKNVTSPGGTTERAIARFQADNLDELIQNAMRDCAAHAEAMSKEFGA